MSAVRHHQKCQKCQTGGWDVRFELFVTNLLILRRPWDHYVSFLSLQVKGEVFLRKIEEDGLRER